MTNKVKEFLNEINIKNGVTQAIIRRIINSKENNDMNINNLILAIKQNNELSLMMSRQLWENEDFNNNKILYNSLQTLISSLNCSCACAIENIEAILRDKDEAIGM